MTDRDVLDPSRIQYIKVRSEIMSTRTEALHKGRQRKDIQEPIMHDTVMKGSTHFSLTATSGSVIVLLLALASVGDELSSHFAHQLRHGMTSGPGVCKMNPYPLSSYRSYTSNCRSVPIQFRGWSPTWGRAVGTGRMGYCSGRRQYERLAS